MRRVAARLLAMRHYQDFRSLGFGVQPYQIERKVGFCNPDVGMPVAAASRDAGVVDFREAIQLERGDMKLRPAHREVELLVLERDRGEHRGSLDAAFLRDP